MAGRGLVVELGGVEDGDHTGVGIDGEAPVGAIRECVGDGIGAVGVAGAGGDPDRGAVGGVLGDRVGRAVAVADRAGRYPATGCGLLVISGIFQEVFGRGWRRDPRRRCPHGNVSGGRRAVVCRRRAVTEGGSQAG